jgi:hypothetical protein
MLNSNGLHGVTSQKTDSVHYNLQSKQNVLLQLGTRDMQLSTSVIQFKMKGHMHQLV